MRAVVDHKLGIGSELLRRGDAVALPWSTTLLFTWQARATADLVRFRLHLRHLVPGGVPGAEGAQSGGRLVRYPKPWQGLRAPVHRAGQADGLGPQSATCSPGFRDAPRFALVARVLPGAAPSRSETLTLAPHAPRLGPEIRIGVASRSSTQARTVKIRMLRTDGFGYPESAQRCSNPLRHPSGRVSPTLRPDRCLPRGPHSIYAPEVVACQGVGQPSDLSSIISSTSGFSFLAMVIA